MFSPVRLFNNNWADIFSSLGQLNMGLVFERFVSIRIVRATVDCYFEVAPRFVLFVLRIVSKLFQFNHLSDIAVYDNPEYILRFVFNYIVNSIESANRIVVRTAYAAIQPVFSVVGFFSNANWFEREVMEMFNILLAGHPNSCKLLGDYTSDVGYLRKGQSDSNLAKLEQSDVTYAKILFMSSSFNPSIMQNYLPDLKTYFAMVLLFSLLAMLIMPKVNRKYEFMKTSSGRYWETVVFYGLFFTHFVVGFRFFAVRSLFEITDDYHDYQTGLLISGSQLGNRFRNNEFAWEDLAGYMQSMINALGYHLHHVTSSGTAPGMWHSFFKARIVFLDGVSLWLVWLTVVVSFILILLARDDQNKSRAMWQNRLVVMVALLSIVCFFTTDLLVFFMSFEATLVPLYFLVGVFGSRSEKSRAATMLFIYTLVGSSFLWVGVLYCYTVLGTTHFDEVFHLLSANASGANSVLFWCMFLGFAFKVPVILLHVWLTVAHVEAPTVGSVLLAGLILKLGGYGLLRWVVLLLPAQTMQFGLYVSWVCLLGYVVATFFAVQQTDLKRFIAYTSISHMNFGTAVLFNHTDIGLSSYLHTLISHGVIASGLFILVGFVYYQTGSRDSMTLNALGTATPQYSIFWFLLIVANAGIPMFSAFPGEFFGLLSLVQSNGMSFLALAFIGFFVTAVYSFVNLIRVLYGSLGESELTYLRDANEVLTAVMYALIGWSILLGMCPDVVFRTAQFCLDDFSYRRDMINYIKPRLSSLINEQKITRNPFDFPGTSAIESARYFVNSNKYLHENIQYSAIAQFNANSKSAQFLGVLTPGAAVPVVENIKKFITENGKAMFPDDLEHLIKFVNLVSAYQVLGDEYHHTSPTTNRQVSFAEVLAADPEVMKAERLWAYIAAVWADGGIISQSKAKLQTSGTLLVDWRRLSTYAAQARTMNYSSATWAPTEDKVALRLIKTNIDDVDVAQLWADTRTPEDTAETIVAKEIVAEFLFQQWSYFQRKTAAEAAAKLATVAVESTTEGAQAPTEAASVAPVKPTTTSENFSKPHPYFRAPVSAGLADSASVGQVPHDIMKRALAWHENYKANK